MFAHLIDVSFYKDLMEVCVDVLTLLMVVCHRMDAFLSYSQR